MRTRILLPLLLLAGCAFEPGEGFAVLEPTVRAAYTPQPSRDAGEGYQRLSSDYQVRVDAASLGLARIDLLGRTGSAGPTSFDPANPPPGYTICHNGHCDREDGALVPYEEVEAELSGGAAAATTVATLPVGDVNLLAPMTRTVGCEPDCELPQTTVSNGRWTVSALRLMGAVRDSRMPPRFAGERPFLLELATTGDKGEPVVTFAGALDVPSDREHEPRVGLDLTLDVTPAVFDALDWAATEADQNGVVDLNDPKNEAARTALIERLAALQPEAKVTRDER